MTLTLPGCTVAEAAWRHRKYGMFYVEQREGGFVALREVAPHAFITLTEDAAVSFAQATARCRAEIERLDAEARSAKELQPCAL